MRPVSVTARAAKHLSSQLAKHPGAIGVRLSVERAGCSGFGYRVDPADVVGDDDEVFEGGGERGDWVDPSRPVRLIWVKARFPPSRTMMVMSRSSVMRVAVCLLAAFLAGSQAAAAARACDIGSRALHLHSKDAALCAEAAPGVAHCAPEHRAVCVEHAAAVPEAKAGWPELGRLADAAGASPARANFAMAAALASRLSRLVPEARNLSIALLNLRQ